MKSWYKFLDFLIKNSIWVALSAMCLTWITYLNFNPEINLFLIIFNGCATVIGYNFIKNPNLLKTLTPNPYYLINGLAITGCAVTFFYLKSTTQLALLLPFTLTLFYIIPLKKYPLRRIPRIKIYITGICWALVTVVLPALEAETTSYNFIILEFTQRILFVVALTIPFEIRDLNVDDSTLKTIPQQTSIEFAKYTGIILLLLCCVIELYKTPIIEQRSTTYIIAALTCLLTYVTNNNNAKYLVSFGVEGIPMLWLGLIYLM